MTSAVLEPPISNEGIISKGTLKKHSIQSLIDNSDSEFEMFHHKSSKIMKREETPLNKSVDHDISDNKSGSGNSTNSDTDFADNELAVFSKDKAQETVKKSQPDKDSIRKYLISTKPPSTSSSSSDDTFDKTSRQSFHSELAPSTSKDSSECIRSPNKGSSQSIKSSRKGSSETTKSPSKGSSGSIKRSSETIKSPSKTSLKSIKLNDNPHSLSDEDEMIPASQNLRSSLQFDLSSGQLDKSNSRLSENPQDSENSSVTESSLDPDDSCSSDTEKVSTPPRQEKTQNIDLNETWLSEFLGKAINATNFTNKISGTPFLNKITDDEDLFLIQCPEEIDPSSFKDKNIILNGNSSISVKNDGESYEYCAIKDNMKRFVSLVIPNEDQTRFRLGQVCIAGSVLLTESIVVPKLVKPPPSPLKKVQYPEKLETLCSSLPAPDAPSVYAVDVPFSNDSFERMRHKHKGARKKKRKRESSEGYISDHENISTKNVKETLEDSSPIPPTHSPKKKKIRKDCELPDFNNDSIKPEDIRIKIEPNKEEETPEFGSVKKKKKKSKTKDSLGEYYSEETFLNVKQELLDENIKQELDVPVMKKKKKKRKSSDDYVN